MLNCLCCDLEKSDISKMKIQTHEIKSEPKNASEYKVKDIMTIKPVTVSEEATIEQCAQIMSERKIGSVIIEDDTISGLLTEQDIIRKVIAKGFDPKSVFVRDVMVKDLVTISSEASLISAIQIMAKHEIRHLPVVSKTDLEGFITAKDILRFEPKLFDEMTKCFKIINKHKR